MSYRKELPFSMDYVLRLDLPGVKRYKAAKGFNIDCPFCGRKNKLNVDGAVWRCPACDASGGIISFHGRLKNKDRWYAYEDLAKRWDALSEEEKEKTKRDKEEGQRAERTPAPILLRDAFYRSFLDLLKLAPDHHEDLRKRGLSDNEIAKRGYKTVPQTWLQNYVDDALHRMTIKGMNYTSEEVYGLFMKRMESNGIEIPGLYVKEDGSITMLDLPRGYFVPVRGYYDCSDFPFGDLISGLQIRNDPLLFTTPQWIKDRYHKYSWFSSSCKETGCGTTGIENIHITGFPDDGSAPKAVYITEGPLKADVASFLSCRPFLGLTGVSNTRQLPKLLEEMKRKGTEKGYICIDSDYREKSTVRKAMNSIEQNVLNAGLECEVLVWDAKYKGIDDWLLAKKKGKRDGRKGKGREIKETVSERDGHSAHTYG